MFNLPSPVAVVCHDAGAANIIFSWLESAVQLNPQSGKLIRIYALGPAKKLVNNFKIEIVPRSSSIEDALKDARVLLAGTGWATSTELRALVLAKHMGIRAIAVIDHWINYLERFTINDYYVDPKEIWVTDLYAKSIADGQFPNSTITLRENCYLTRATEKIKNIIVDVHKALRILYVLEPIRVVWKEDKQIGEFDALEYFLRNLNELSFGSIEEIMLRPHPSDQPNKYSKWLNGYNTPKITLDLNRGIEYSIAWADVVVGCQTMAMIVALQAGKRVISSMPPWAPTCALPHKGIEKMAELLPIKNS